MLEKTSQNQTRNLQNAMSLSGEADRRQVKIVRISSLTPPPPFTVNSYLGNTARVLVRDVREWSGSCVETSAQGWAKVVMQTWARVAGYLCFDGMRLWMRATTRDLWGYRIIILVLAQCWHNVFNAVPTSTQHWVKWIMAPNLVQIASPA